jgi:CO/xanthine dehydrogenase Mo-binding subunit
MAEEFNEKKPWLWRPPKGKDGYIGKRGLRPKEANEKVTGKAIFANDVYLPGMLYAKVYRAPHAHARIKNLDSSKAEALPGVWGVIRYDDPDANLLDTFKLMQPGAPWFYWNESILPGTVDFPAARVGAIVIADNEEICDRALKLIGEGIEWEVLPFILDPEDAAKPDAPLMHPELNPKNNIWKDIVIINQGDVEKGFKSSDHVIEFYQSKRDDDVWAGVEPGCMVAQWKGDELEMWYHGQFPGMDVATILPVFKSDEKNTHKIKIHTLYSGACFGGNAMGFTAHLTRYAAMAAKKTNRAVKFVDDYAMCWEGVSFETGTARYKVGFNDDGKIISIKLELYQITGLPITEKFRDALSTPNIYIHEVHSYWSKAHESCWKDGAANCAFTNMIVNKVAGYLKMDPIKVQLLNDGIEGHDMAWLDENVKKHYGLPVRDSLKEVVEAGKKAFGWDEKWHLPGTRKLPNGKMHGVGFYAAPAWSSGVHGGSTPGLAMNKDGTCTLYFRRADTGQSGPTTYCQIIADELGLRYEDVKIENKEFSNFEAFPTANSGGAAVNSYGLILAAREMKKLLLEYALKPLKGRMIASSYKILYSEPAAQSPFHGIPIEDLDIKEGIIFEKANPKNTLPVKTLIDLNPGNITASEGGPFFVTSRLLEVPDIEEFYKLARQACFVEVEVDTETGQVEVTKLVHPYDVGQSINPDVHDQQLIGGAYQGVGVSATEAIYYDPETGVKLNDNLIGYPMLSILDLGPVDCPIIETHLGWSPYGLYGCSESGKAVTAAAILVPAVYNAIGKWIEETPVTPDRVLKALGKA